MLEIIATGTQLLTLIAILLGFLAGMSVRDRRKKK